MVNTHLETHVFPSVFPSNLPSRWQDESSEEVVTWDPENFDTLTTWLFFFKVFKWILKLHNQQKWGFYNQTWWFCLSFFHFTWWSLMGSVIQPAILMRFNHYIWWFSGDLPSSYWRVCELKGMAHLVRWLISIFKKSSSQSVEYYQLARNSIHNTLFECHSLDWFLWKSQLSVKINQ